MGLALGLGIGPTFGSAANPRFVSFASGGVVSGETFTRAGTNATFFDTNGILQTAGQDVKRDGHFIGGVRTLLLEGPATNIVVAPRDLTNVAWVHTTMTPALDQTGIDGAANSASSILATGANATSLQTITLASSTRAQQCWVKRLVGAGAVSMTMDNVTFTAITVTGAWTQVTIPSQAGVVNPVVGFKLATSGDKIAVDFVDNETGTFSTSPVIGSRSADVYSIPLLIKPQELTVYAKYIDLGASKGGAGGSGRIFQISTVTAAAELNLNGNVGGYQTQIYNGGFVSSPSIGNSAFGDSVEARCVFSPAGLWSGSFSANGGAESGQQSAAYGSMPAAFGAQTIQVGRSGLTNQGCIGLIALKILAGTRSLAEMRAA